MPSSPRSRNSADATDTHSEAGSAVSANFVMRCALRGSVESFGAHIEAEECEREAVQTWLLERDVDNKSPLDMAAILDHADMVKELIAKGVDPNDATGSGSDIS